MKKARDVGLMIRLFFRLLYEMIVNYFRLNKDIDHNFQICKRICRKIVRSAKIDLRIDGSENFPQRGNFLIVSNHRCFFDVVFLLATVEQTIRFVAAKELWHYPVLRKYLSSIGCVALDRYAQEMESLKKSIQSMKEALGQGNIVLFPEGECSYHNPQMRKFKKGGFLGLPSQEQKIVPVFLQIGSLCNMGRWMIPRGEVVVYVGEVFSPSDIPGKRKTAGEIAAYAQQCIERLQKEKNE